MLDLRNKIKSQSTPKPSSPPAAPVTGLSSAAAKERVKLRFSSGKIILFCVLIIFIYNYVADKNTWRAVFLTNSQVYFGHLVSFPFWPTAYLNDVYYVQVQTSLQAGSSTAPLKLFHMGRGNELHLPQDKMAIPVNQILYVQDLQNISAVVSTIKELQKRDSK